MVRFGQGALRGWWAWLFIGLDSAVSGLYGYWILRGDLRWTALVQLALLWTGVGLGIFLRPLRRRP